jgi:hypothetical protein
MRRALDENAALFREGAGISGSGATSSSWGEPVPEAPSPPNNSDSTWY